MPFLLLRFPLRQLLWLWCVYLFMLFVFSLLQPSILVLYSLCLLFYVNMPWGSSFLVKYVWCPRGFLYLNGQNFLEILEIFCYFFYWIYCESLLLRTILFLQCPRFSHWVFWCSRWVLAYSFHRSWVVWQKFFSFLSFLFYLQVLRFCLLLVLACWSGLPLCFVFLFNFFF
jgi:hypothetical protein